MYAGKLYAGKLYEGNCTQVNSSQTKIKRREKCTQEKLYALQKLFAKKKNYSQGIRHIIKIVRKKKKKQKKAGCVNTRT